MLKIENQNNFLKHLAFMFHIYNHYKISMTQENTSFTFVKGAAAQTLTPADGAHFSGITSSWMPL